MSNLSQHIPFVRLVDLLDGRLSHADQAELAPHLATCPRCAADFAWLKHVSSLMRTDTAIDAPAYAVAAAKHLFRERAQPPRPSLRQQLKAMIQFDSARAPLAFGLRSGLHAERQMLFTVDSYLIDLRIAPSGAQWAVSGQLLGAAGTAQIELSGPAGLVQAELNELHEFNLPPAAPGNYVLSVQLPESDITIADLELGA